MDFLEEPWRSYPQETGDYSCEVLNCSSYRTLLEEDSERLFAKEDVDIEVLHRGPPEGLVENMASEARKVPFNF